MLCRRASYEARLSQGIPTRHDQSAMVPSLHPYPTCTCIHVPTASPIAIRPRGRIIPFSTFDLKAHLSLLLISSPLCYFAFPHPALSRFRLLHSHLASLSGRDRDLDSARGKCSGALSPSSSSSDSDSPSLDRGESPPLSLDRPLLAVSEGSVKSFFREGRRREGPLGEGGGGDEDLHSSTPLSSGEGTGGCRAGEERGSMTR